MATEAAAQNAGKRRLLRIASGCATRETFVAVFRRFCDGDSIFIATKTPKPKGAELRFAITLADGQPLIIGQGVVDRSDTDNKGEFGRPGMRIKFVDVSSKSRELIDELAGKKAPVIPPIPRLSGSAAARSAQGAGKSAAIGGKAPDGDRRTILGMAPLSIPTIKLKGKAAAADSKAAPAKSAVDSKADDKAADSQPLVESKSAGQGKADDKAADSKAADSKATDSKAAEGKAAEGKAAEGKAAEGKAAEGKAAEGKAAEGKAAEGEAATETQSAQAGAAKGKAKVEPLAKTAKIVKLSVERDKAEAASKAAASDDPSVAATDQAGQPGEAKPAKAADSSPATAESPAGKGAALSESSSLEPASSEQDEEGAGWEEANGLDDTRVRGGPMVVPANPLEELDAEALDAFVECTLYEDDGGFGEGEPTVPGDLDWLGEHTPPWDDPLTADDTAEASDDDDSAAAAAAVAAAPVGEGESATAPRSHWPLTAAIAGAAALVGVFIGYAASGGSGDGTNQDTGKAASAATHSSEEEGKATTPAMAPPDAAMVEPVAGAIDAGTVASIDAAAAAGQGAVAADELVDQGDEEDDEGLIDDGEPPSDPALAKLVGTPLAGDACAADITSRPDAVAVYRDGVFAGRTPLRVMADCGVHEFELRHPRYANEKRRIKLTAGELKSVRMGLQRPDYKMRIGSVPRGATVKVNGKKVGITPLITTIKGYQRMTVTVEKAGYKTWRKRVYAKKPMTNYSLKLNRGK